VGCRGIGIDIFSCARFDNESSLLSERAREPFAVVFELDSGSGDGRRLDAGGVINPEKKLGGGADVGGLDGVMSLLSLVLPARL